ncbi:hypothetical protein IGJ28_001126 [Enterococcus sp. AZ091]|uniref:hypothetical protein n=1 Tax=Enterococcus sp. AZ091 TaxID=2774720 RepID=UPI003F2492DF
MSKNKSMERTIEIAKGKLERIRNEQEAVQKEIRFQHDHIPFGQPNIIGRPDIYKKVKGHYEKSRRLLKEEEKQEKRIEMLEKVASFKEKNKLLKDVHVVGKSGYATVGAKTSVNNLEFFREQLKELERLNEEAKAYNKTKPAIKHRTYGDKITKLKRKIVQLELMQERDRTKIVSEKTQKLIDSGAVIQWKKKPIFYFVKGLKKVALEIDQNGEFYISSFYPAYTESDKQFVHELLNDDMATLK